MRLLNPNQAFIRVLAFAVAGISATVGMTSCRLSANNSEKLQALKSGETYDEDGVLNIAITSPASDALINASSDSSAYAIEGTCSPDGASIHLLLNDAEVQSASSKSSCSQGAWAMTLDTTAIADGTHGLVAVLSNSNGRTKSSGSVSIRKDTAIPQLAITLPSAGSFINSSNDSASFALSGTCSESARTIQVKVDSASVTQSGGDCNGATWAATISTLGLSTGAHSLQASISSASGNTQDSATVVITKDTTAPTVSITTPSNNSYVNLGNNSASFAVTGGCNDATASVQVKIDGSNSGSAVGCGGTNWNATISTVALSQGVHTLTANITDPAGNSAASSAISVTKDTAAPTIAITSPAASSYVNLGNNSTTFAIQGSCTTATENGRSVTIQVDGANATQSAITCGASNAWSGTFSTVALSEGAHTLTAILSDAAGNSATSTGIGVTKDTNAPSTTLTYPSSGIVINPNTDSTTYSVKGTCTENGRAVTLSVNGSTAAGLASNTCSSDSFSATIDTTGLGNAAHTITATTTDAAGNSGPSTPPSITLSKDTARAMGTTFLRTSVAYDPYTGAQSASGVARHSTVSSATGVVIEEATTNLMAANSELFTAASGWIAYAGATVTVTGGQSDPFGGTGAYRIQTSGGTSNEKYYINSGTSVSGTKYTQQVWVKNNTAANTVRVYLYPPGSTITVTQAEGWKLVKLENQTGNGGVIQMSLGGLNASDVMDFNVMNPQVEAKAYATSYIPPQATRSGENLMLPTAGILNADQGAIVMRAYVSGDAAAASAVGYHALFDLGVGSSTNRMRLSREPGTLWRVITYDASATANSQSYNTAVTTGWHIFGVRWIRSSQTIEFWIDGEKVANSTSASLPNAFGSYIWIGSYLNNNPYQWNAPIDYFATYQHAPTGDEIDAYTTTGPASPDYRLDFNGASFTRASVAYEVSTATLPVTWSSTDKGTNVTLSSNNLAVTALGSIDSVRATHGKSSGKWYWEVTLSGSPTYTTIGIGNPNMNLDQYVGYDANGYAIYQSSGNKLNNSGAGAGTAYGSSFSAGDVIGVAFDATAGTLTFYKNGASYGTAFTGIPAGTWFPALGCGTSGSCGGTMTANFGATAFAYTLPAGYSAFNLSGAEIASGKERYVTSGGSTGIVLEEGTTNGADANQSSAETDASGFLSSGTTTASRITSWSWQGAYAWQVASATDQGPNYFGVNTVSITNGTTYTASAYVKNPGGSSISVTISVGGGAQTTYSIAAGETKRIWSTYTAAATTPTTIRFSEASGQTFYVDGIQFEAKAYPTGWHIGGGTRNAETLSIASANRISATSGAVRARVMSFRGTDANTPQIVFDAGGAGITGLNGSIDATGKFRTQAGNGSSSVHCSGTTVVTPYTWYTVEFRWNTTEVKTTVNGTTENTCSNTNGIVLFADGKVYIANMQSGIRQLDGVMDWIEFENSDGTTQRMDFNQSLGQ